MDGFAMLVKVLARSPKECYPQCANGEAWFSFLDWAFSILGVFYEGWLRNQKSKACRMQSLALRTLLVFIKL